VRTHAGFDKKFQHTVYTLCIKYTYKYNEKYFIDHALPINHATRLLRNIDWSCLQVNGSRQEEWNRASESALVHFLKVKTDLRSLCPTITDFGGNIEHTVLMDKFVLGFRYPSNFGMTINDAFFFLIHVIHVRDSRRGQKQPCIFDMSDPGLRIHKTNFMRLWQQFH